MAKNIFSKLLMPLLLLLMTALPKQSAAQDSLAFSPNSLSGLPDTVVAGDTIVFGSYVYNFGNVLFYDTMSVTGYVDTTGNFTNTIPFYIPQAQPIYLNPGDSAFIISVLEFRAANAGGFFKIGNNTIVIWPARAHTNSSPVDSLVLHVLVIDTTTGLGPIPPDLIEVRCYPVPGSGPLYITSSSANTQPKSAIIYDAEGKLVHYTDDLSSGVVTQTLPIGVYYIEVIFDNNQRRTYKIVRW